MLVAHWIMDSSVLTILISFALAKLKVSAKVALHMTFLRSAFCEHNILTEASTSTATCQ